jgi:isopentenyl phosphate kinase
MKSLYILKLGGSVVTHKNRPKAAVRYKLLSSIATTLKTALDGGKIDLILVHGAGAHGHQLAKKYSLQEGINDKPERWYGSFLTRLKNQKLNTVITEIFVAGGLRITPVHTASVIIQDKKQIVTCDLAIIREALSQNCIPLLYGEMVYDRTLGMSICSGDAILPYLEKKLRAEKLFFASDIEGIFTADPHIHKNAQLIEKISLHEIEKKAALYRSHNIDVTDGLLGKIKKLLVSHSPNLKTVEIFNGLNADNYQKIFLKKPFPHTTISIKKHATKF